MKYTYQIRTADFEYIMGEYAGTAEEAVLEYRELKRAFEGGTGIGVREFAKVLHEYCSTGNIVNGGDYDFSAYEKSLLAEVRRLTRNLKK